MGLMWVFSLPRHCGKIFFINIGIFIGFRFCKFKCYKQLFNMHILVIVNLFVVVIVFMMHLLCLPVIHVIGINLYHSFTHQALLAWSCSCRNICTQSRLLFNSSE